MDRRIEDDVEGWPTRQIDGGYAGLRELASADFSGAVRSGATWLFMLNGRVVGVFDGDVEDFEDAEGTAHKAPHRSLPLLYAMQETGGETRAKYYTNDTPVTEVDSTLSEGGFTGYVELSENVLSGDYYVVYHAGRAMSLAFVGNNERLVTGDEAFELADDEVGIYEVNDVDVDVRDVPSPDGRTDAGGGDSAPGADADVDAPGRGAESTAPDGAASTDPSGSGAATGDAGVSTSGGDADATTDTDVDTSRSGDSGTTPDAGTGAAPDANATTSDADATTAPDVDATTASDAAADATAGSGVEPDQSESGPAGSSEESPTLGNPDATTDEVTEAEPGESTPGDDRRERSAGDAVDRPASDAPESDASAPDGSETAAGGAESSASDGSGPSASVDPGDRRGRSDAQPSVDGAPSTSGTSDDAARSREPEAGPGTGIAGDDAEVLEDEEPTTAGEEAWREATTIPSLDPDHTAEGPPGADKSTGRGTEQGRQPTPGRSRQTASGQSDQSSSDRPDQSPSGQSGGSTSERRDQGTSGRAPQAASDGEGATRRRERSAGTHEDADDTFEQEVLEREDRIDRLQQRLSNLEGERGDLVQERDRLTEAVEELEEENETLRAEVRRLEREVEELESASGGAGGDDAGAGGAVRADSTGDADGSRTLDPRTALTGTDLFVRYGSKGAATLEGVHDDAEAAEVNENLRLDLHTRFDAEDVTVDGEPFGEFLEETMGYRFVAWLVRDLPFEIRDTGQQSALRDLYDALSEIDRVEFDGTVELSYQDGGEAVHEEETFDVVVRDRMGEPLVVANLNDSRDPATGRMLVDLQEAASRVKEANAALVGAFFVTRSFFEPEALETASEATSGSLLSRDSRRSYVKLSRKQGYHLCLVEARGDDLHLNVPEL